jgi:hypothetical protein
MKDEEQHPEHLSDRLKEEVPKFMKEQFGHIEQQPPNKPSFLFVVLLSGLTLIIIFIIAWTILRWGGGARFLNRSHRKAPTSQLIMPAVARPAPHALAS